MLGLEYISGNCSGIDGRSWVDQVIFFEPPPACLLRACMAGEDLLLASCDILQGTTASLKGRLDSLQRFSHFQAMADKSCISDLVSVSTRDGAAAGFYNFRVQHIAQNHQVFSQDYSGEEESLATGSGRRLKGDAEGATTRSRGVEVRLTEVVLANLPRIGANSKSNSGGLGK